MAEFNARLAEDGVFATGLQNEQETGASLEETEYFRASLEAEADFTGALEAGGTFTGHFESFQKGGDYDVYTGAYSFTPSQEAQTVQISGKVALQNITVEAIPSYYGRITYNGSSIKVS